MGESVDNPSHRGLTSSILDSQCVLGARRMCIPPHEGMAFFVLRPELPAGNFCVCRRLAGFPTRHPFVFQGDIQSVSTGAVAHGPSVLYAPTAAYRVDAPPPR